MSRETVPILDADLHHHYRAWSDIEPYLPDGVELPYSGGPPSPKVTGTFREDTVSPRGGLPASDPEFVVENHLDRWGIDYAILSCGSTLRLGDLPDLDTAASIARATNDWTINDWFPVDERYLGAIVINPNDPDQAADEIRRVGSHPRMVVVTTTAPPRPLGQSFMDPIFEACVEVDLPLNLHPGAPNINSARSGATTMCEFRSTMSLIGIQNLMSLVYEGVFAKFPTFRFVLNEWGVAWLPFALWRMDMEYREHREEIPWLTRLPSEYVRDHVRFTTQPIEEPENRGDFATLMSLVGGIELLIFSSDYPHHDFDSPPVALNVFPKDWQRKVFFENACDWYKLEERLDVRRPALAGVG